MDSGPKRKSKTQVSEDHEHLCLQIPQSVPSIHPNPSLIPKAPNDDCELQTNFGISVFNPYCFVLLHLRNRGNKNPIGIHIPEVCIFHERSPYEIVFSSKGHVRGYKQNNSQLRLRLKDLNKIFKDSWGTNNLSKQEPSVASFAEKQMLMLSDNDLFLICCKNKVDPFFKKLRYIQNKINVCDDDPIHSVFPSRDGEIDLIKLATESLLGFKAEQQVRKFLSENQYLEFLNEKIVLFLNYEHNIRVHRGTFIYMKAQDNKFYLVNVQKLEFTNLTAAILHREKRLAEIEEQKNRILIMTPEKEVRYRSYENKEKVRVFERVMGNQFNSIVRRMNLNTVSDNKRQQVKNELAFKKLHPKSRLTYTQVVTSEDFLKTKNKVFNISNRKPLTIPSRKVRRFYNKLGPEVGRINPSNTLKT